MLKNGIFLDFLYCIEKFFKFGVILTFILIALNLLLQTYFLNKVTLDLLQLFFSQILLDNFFLTGHKTQENQTFIKHLSFFY